MVGGRKGGGQGSVLILKAAGYGINDLAMEVAALFDIEPERIFSPGKYPLIVQARSLLCFWSVRKLGLTATEVARKLNLTQPAVGMAVKRGETIAKERGLTLSFKENL